MDELRYSTLNDSPITIVLKDGVELKAEYLDGGGMEIGGDVYEVHGAYLDGEFLNVPQDQILRAVSVTGEEVEFGNPYMPGHPRPKDLHQDRPY